MKRIRKANQHRIANHVRDGIASEAEITLFQQFAETDAEFLAREAETDAAMAFLRDSAVEPQVSDDFDGRLIRAWRMESRKRTVAYWSPVIAGGLVAAACLLTVLQLLLNGPEIKKADIQGQEAKLEAKPDPAFSSFRDSTSQNPK